MFVKNYPALKLENNLIVADLHLGISFVFRQDGFHIPEQGEKISKQINHLLKKTRTKNLIIVGDFKHAVPGTPEAERKELRRFTRSIKADITVLKGNHDSLLEEIIDVKIINRINIENHTLTHGHIKTKGKKFIIGHNHPLILFKDRENMSYRQRIWIKNDNIIIMPAFNKLAGGMVMNKKNVELQGPVAKNINLNKSDAYLLDGTHLGKIEDIIVD